MKCCVFVRAFYETPYINFFVEHYLKMGFDKIIVLKTDDLEYNVFDEFSDYVEIHNVINEKNQTYNVNKDLIQEYDWVLTIDIDEILYLNKEFKNIKQFIKKYNDSDSLNFIFRWGIMKNCGKDLSDHFYKSIYIKTMGKTPIKKISPHLVYNGKYVKLNSRPIKIVHKKYYIEENDYNDSIMLHLHVRSTNNIFIKFLVSEIPSRIIKNKENIVDFLNSDSYDLAILEKLLGSGRSIFQYTSIEDPKNKKQKFEKEKYHQYDYKHPIIDKDLEEELLKSIFSKYKINYENYKKNIPSLEDQINKKLESI